MARTLGQAFGLKNNIKSIFGRPKDNLAPLDGLRAISIIWVVIFHVYILVALSFSAETAQQLLRNTPWFFNWIWNGDKGVDIFFVMSGFLISGLLFKEHQQTNTLNLKSFYIRRFLRLTPVYWFSLTLYFLLNGPNAENIWANFLYINNFLPSSDMAMTWTWSLAVEEQFYLITPLFLLLVFWKSNHKTAWLIGLALLSLLIRYLLLINEPDLINSDLKTILNLERSDKFNLYFDRMYVDLHARFGPFICGIFASHLFFHHREALATFFNSRKAKPVIYIGLAIVIALALAPSYHQDVTYPEFYSIFYIVFNRTLFSVGITLLLLAALFPYEVVGRTFQKILSAKFWLPIAHLSYSIYIFHILVVSWIHLNIKVLMKNNSMPTETVDFYWLLAAIPVALFVSCIIAALLYVFIEKPFMNLRRGFRPELGVTNGSAPQTSSSEK